MPVAQEVKVRKDILDVFKTLGLEDPAERARFRNLANHDGASGLKKRRDDSPSTRNNTIEEREEVHA